MRRVLVLALVLTMAHTATASIVLVNDQSSGDWIPVEPDIPYGKIIDGTDLGKNQTNATVPLSGTLSLSTKDGLYVNNTNSSRVHYVKMQFVSGTNLTNLQVLKLGIDNGTKTAQIVIDSGSLTQSEGPYVRLEPGTTNTIYIKEDLDLLSTLSIVKFKMFSADTSAGNSYVITRGEIKLGV